MISGPIHLELTEWVVHYGVVLLRVLGLFVFVPIFGSELTPLRIRVGMASLLALAFLPIAPTVAIPWAEPFAWVTVAVRELSVGLGLGLAAKMVFAGIEGAAGIIASQSGFAMASMVDPMSGDQALAPAMFQNLLAITLLLAANLHHMFIQAIVASYELLPPSAAMPSFGAFDTLAGMAGARLFQITVMLAGPALVVTFSVDLVMALVGRAMAQVPILLVAYPFKMGVGLVAILLLARTTGSAVDWLGRTIAKDASTIIAALGAR